MKFVWHTFESLSEDATITTNFLRLPVIKELKKLKNHIYNTYSTEVNTIPATFNNKKLGQL